MISSDIVFESKPQLQSVIGLLDAVDLPYSDLNDGAMQNFIAASFQHRMIATIGLEQYGTSGLLRSLVVDKDFRGYAVGEALIAKLEQLAATKNIQKLFLLTNDADGYFAKLGYEIENRDNTPDDIAASPQYASLCPGSAVLMSKSLLNS